MALKAVLFYSKGRKSKTTPYFSYREVNRDLLSWLCDQGEKGDMGQEGDKGEKGETGLKGKEGPNGNPGFGGVRVSSLLTEIHTHFLISFRSCLTWLNKTIYV